MLGLENVKTTLQQHDGEFATDKNKGNWENQNQQIQAGLLENFSPDEKNTRIIDHVRESLTEKLN